MTSPDDWRGVFPILCTPFEDGGRIDWLSLRHEIDYCLAAGARGLVCSGNASEFWTLTENERKQITTTVVRHAGGKVPVVVGVTGGSAEIAVELACHAQGEGANAVMAMPPCVRSAPKAAIFAYYRALSEAVRIPVIVQNHDEPLGTRMTPEFVSSLVNELDHVEFIKEESLPANHAMARELELCGPRLRGVMGGLAGRYVLDEHRRGSCGTMPACEATDVHVQVWDALDRGDETGARALFGRLLPLLNYEALLPGVYKWVLVQRGIISSDYLRSHAGNPLDAGDRAELTRILDELKDLLLVEIPA